MSITPVIAQSNELTKAKYDFDVIEKRIIYILIAHIRQQFVDQHGTRTLFDNLVVNIGTEQLRKCNDNLNRVYDKAKKLRERTILINDNEKFLSVGYINYAKHIKNKPYMEFEVSKEILPYLVELAKNFTTYSLSVAISLRSIYSQRFYELCSQYKSKGYFFISIDELKEMLKIEDKYKDFAQLNNKVISVAESELKELYDKGQSDIYFTWKPRSKEGKKIVSLDFIIHQNETIKNEEEGLSVEDYITHIKLFLQQLYPRDAKYQVRIIDYIKHDYNKAREISEKISAKAKEYHNKPNDMARILRFAFKEDFGIE